MHVQACTRMHVHMAACVPCPCPRPCPCVSMRLHACPCLSMLLHASPCLSMRLHACTCREMCGHASLLFSPRIALFFPQKVMYMAWTWRGHGVDMAYTRVSMFLGEKQGDPGGNACHAACPHMGGHGKAWTGMETHGDTWRGMEKHGDAWRRMDMHIFWGKNRAILGEKNGNPDAVHGRPRRRPSW